MLVVLCPSTRNIHVSRDVDSRQRPHYEDRQFQEPCRSDSHFKWNPRPGRGQDQSSLPTATLSRARKKTGSSRRQGAVTEAGKEADSTNTGQDLARKVSMAFWPYRSL